MANVGLMSVFPENEIQYSKLSAVIKAILKPDNS
jgi:hypothetical protein